MDLIKIDQLLNRIIMSSYIKGSIKYYLYRSAISILGTKNNLRLNYATIFESKHYSSLTKSTTNSRILSRTRTRIINYDYNIKQSRCIAYSHL